MIDYRIVEKVAIWKAVRDSIAETQPPKNAYEMGYLEALKDVLKSLE